jgi:hypothetical protein
VWQPWLWEPTGCTAAEHPLTGHELAWRPQVLSCIEARDVIIMLANEQHNIHTVKKECIDAIFANSAECLLIFTVDLNAKSLNFIFR